VYGLPRAIPGARGCLHDPRYKPTAGRSCAGVAYGLEGAGAVAVTPDGANVYVAAGDDVVALARGRRGSVRPALSPSARACVGSGCVVGDTALGGADALAVSPDGRFVYVGAADSAAVSAFARGPRGVLEPLPASFAAHRHSKPWFGCVVGAPLTGRSHRVCAAEVHALNGITSLAVSPDGRYLYAVSSGLEPGDDSLVTLQRDPRSGGLRPLPASRSCLQSYPGRECHGLAGLEGASAIVISGDGRFVYVASAVSGAVRAFLRDRSSGKLTPLFGPGGCISSGERATDDVPCETTVAQLAGARSIALSPDGRQLYVAAFDPGAVVVLDRDPSSGTLTPAPPECLQALSDSACPGGTPALRGAASLALGAAGSVVYVACEGANGLVELARNPADGSLTLASAIPDDVGGLNGPAALALSPGGDDIYLVSPFDDEVAALASHR
jgi:DNA-binding beta-propeller fold protein YncE